MNGDNQVNPTDHDSYWVRVNGGTWIKFNDIPDNNTLFEWAQIHDSDNGNALQTFTLGVGLHTLDIHLRETWAELDKVFITNSATTPSGTGSTASNCTSNNNPPTLDPIADQLNYIGDSPSLSVNANDPDGHNLSFSATGLPAGITISTSTGTMSGTITANAAIYPVTVTVTDDGIPNKSATQSFDWTVQQTAGTEEIWLEAECRQIANNWASDTSSAASNGQYLYPTVGQSNIYAAPTTSDFIRFPLTVSEGGLYTFFARVDVQDQSGDSYWVRLSTDNQWIKWNAIPNDGNNFVWAQVHDSDNGGALVTAQLSAGTYNLDFHLREPSVKLDKVYVTNTGNSPPATQAGPSDPSCVGGNNPPVLSPIADQTDPEGATVAVQASATDPDGHTLTYTATGLPAGVTIASGTGLMDGTLTASAGTYNVTVTVTDNGSPNLNDSESFTWTVTGTAPSIEEVWLEAECATSGSSWNIGNDGGASNSEYLFTSQGENISTGNITADHQINVDFTTSSNGTYYLWMRVRANWSYNSIWLQQGGSWTQIEFGEHTTYNTWAWYQLPSQSLTTGNHTLTFAKREGGDIDKVVLSNDPAFTPSGQGTVGVNCAATNAAPVAVIDPADSTETAPFTITFDGSGSSDDQGIVNYEWLIADNYVSSPTALSFTHTFLTTGTYSVRLVVSDQQGLTDTAYATVNALAPPVNQPPVAIIDPDDFFGSAPTSLMFDGSQSYDDKGIVEYEWKLAGNTQGGADTLIDPMDIKMTASFPLADTFTIYLTVWDEEGLSGTDSSTIYLEQATEIPTGEVLLVVGDAANLSIGDEDIHDRLVDSLGHTVLIRDDNAYTPADLDGKILVIISSTVSSGVVGSQFTNVDLPLINYEEAVSDELKMVGADTDAARDGGETQINIVDADHFMASGLNGMQTVYSYAGDITYGVPNQHAYFVASLDTDPSRATIFGYDKDSLMFDGLTAPARRVGFFLYGDMPDALTPVGWQLFDDAVCWALGCDLYLTICTSTPMPVDEPGYIAPSGVVSPTQGENYIRSTTYRGAAGTSPVHQVGYFDGLGRGTLQVDVQATPLGQDMLVPMEYDAFGRQPKQYLPIASGAGGAYSNPGSGGFYSAGNFPYIPGGDLAVPFSETEFEASPLNRVLEQGAPGADWQLGQHTVTTEYLTNAGGEIGYAPDGSSITYAAGELMVVKVTDENGSITETATDKLGRTVYKKAHLATGAATTYFGYDAFGNVRHVVQPKGNGVVSDELAFQYEYDDRQRVKRKRIPGTNGWTVIYYDELDRVIATTDPKNTTIATEYDDFSRPVKTGYGGPDGSIATILSETFYDEYQGFKTFQPAAPPVFGQTPLLSPQLSTKVKGKVTAVKVKVLGINTWLTTETFYDEYGREIQTVADNYRGGEDRVTNFYNYAGDMLASVLEHDDGQGTTLTVKKAFDYDHRGRLLRITQQVDDNTPEIIAQYRYNELGQLQHKRLAANSCEDQLQKVDYTYNIRGWMTGINLTDGGAGYDLDLTCAAAASADDLFGLKLDYNEGTTQIGAAGAPLYNGNISGLQWQSAVQPLDANLPTCQKRGYGFIYDELNRLKSAIYAEGENLDVNLDRYTMAASYDLNGNITSLFRQGLIGSNATFGVMDGLTYTYENGGNSNRLAGVTDGSGSSNTPVVDGPITWEDQFLGTSASYTYDANGNIINDGNKFSDNATYNHLNKPTQVNLANGGSISYIYAADGSKLQQVSTVNGTTTTHDYIGGFFYVEGELKYFAHEEGRVFNDAGDYRYEYNLTDHLGNVRLSFTDLNADGLIDTDPTVGEILQEDHYYPFGLRLGGLSNSSGVPNRYRYNGKELNDELGLNLYDYGFRWYDPAVARFVSVDPIAEYYPHNAVYAYAENRPIDGVDLDGLEYVDFRDIPRAIGTIDEILADPSLTPDEQLGLIFHTDDAINTNEDLINGYIEGYIESMSMALTDGLLEMPGTLDVVQITAKAPGRVGRFFRNLWRGLNKSYVDDIPGEVHVKGFFGKNKGPKEPYNRRKHYGKTPKKSDRKHFETGDDEVVDHDPPLVKRYYEGDPKTGELPGYMQTPKQRKASANDRNRMNNQPAKDSHKQGGEMSGYSKRQKKKWFPKKEK